MKVLALIVAAGMVFTVLLPDTAQAGTKRYERGAERVTVGSDKGQEGYWIEYEEYMFESAAEKLAELDGGRLKPAELAALTQQIRKSKATLTSGEIEKRIRAIIAARPKPRPAPPKSRK
ncbi:MAG: hypothetical protein FJZ00_12670 [Candidatus Sericytochromatia bacterium]|uniref:Uncharacterized protein n=1 Tax=Candidatus Tanganyikabacteria bacterium TaxID=2961651 RepID=A0A937X8D3_9BACT|nr:hypothetical protein [Candidatus Tanganyikabacteria bacterium]